MKSEIYLCLILMSCFSSISGQKFEDVVVNPFGINIDTTGGVEIYACNFVDIDNDGDIDIVYSYATETVLFAYQENIGSIINPIFSPLEKLDYQFDIDIGLEIQDFEDMNGDGLIDFVSFGAINDSTGFNCTYFENIGNNVFESKPGAEIGLPGIGYALGIPEIVDLNQDGDKDIILSGATFETFTDESDVMFYYGQNSNPDDPKFVAWFIEPYSFSFMDTFQSAIIRTGDLDLDGDLDLFMRVGITDEDYRYMYQENISPVGEKNDFTGPQLISPFGLPQESEGLPFLEDLDGDGDLDLFTFDDLKIFYYENTACVNTVSEMVLSLCEGESFTLNDQTYSAPGFYSQMLMNNNGCDSTITLNLSINEAKTSQFTEVICEGSSYSWNGEVLSIAGEYDQSFESADGCDSTVTLILTVISTIGSSFTASFCAGDDYMWNTMTYNEAGSYIQNFSSENGCDSIVTLILAVTSTLETSFSDTFCSGGEYIWNTMSYNEAGSYMQNFSSENGCDSIVTLVLAVTSTLETSFSDTFCSDEEYTWNNTSYNEGGKYMQSFISDSGCDSIVELDLSQILIEYTLTQENGTLNLSNQAGTISWINCDTNTEIEGETSSTFTPSENGNYAVRIEDAGCVAISDCVNVMSSSLEDQDLLPEFNLFPNPASDLITIDTKGLNLRLKTATFINLTGQTLTKEITNNTIDISDLLPGFYFVKIKSKADTFIRSLVISR